MPNADLRQDRVDRPDLNPRAATTIAQRGRLDVVLSVRGEKWKGGEMIDDLSPIARPGEPLKQLLQHQARGDYGVPTLESRRQRIDFGCALRYVATEGQ